MSVASHELIASSNNGEFENRIGSPSDSRVSKSIRDFRAERSISILLLRLDLFDTGLFFTPPIEPAYLGTLTIAGGGAVIPRKNPTFAGDLLQRLPCEFSGKTIGVCQSLKTRLSRGEIGILLQDPESRDSGQF